MARLVRLLEASEARRKFAQSASLTIDQAMEVAEESVGSRAVHPGGGTEERSSISSRKQKITLLKDGASNNRLHGRSNH